MSELGIDDTPLARRLTVIEAGLTAALDTKAACLGAALKARIEAKLSGEVLAKKSGALLASLSLEPVIETDSVVMRIVSRDVAYARIQEFGGKTEAHDIVAAKAEALVFMNGGKACFARRVHHPGSLIPERSFMRSALEEMQAAIVGELGATVTTLMRGA